MEAEKLKVIGKDFKKAYFNAETHHIALGTYRKVAANIKAAI